MIGHPTYSQGHSLASMVGRVFVLAMAATALSSFLMHEIRIFGPFSMILLLSIFVLFSLVQAIRSIRRGQVRAHLQAMIGTYIGGIVVAGGFTFLPGRMMAKSSKEAWCYTTATTYTVRKRPYPLKNRTANSMAGYLMLQASSGILQSSESYPYDFSVDSHPFVQLSMQTLAIYSGKQELSEQL